MVTFIQRSWSKPRGPQPLILRLLTETPALGVLLSCPEKPVLNSVEAPLAPSRERIPEGNRGKRMLQLVAQGMLRHPAANQACREFPGGLSENACERRLVRKYNRRRLPGQAN
jgi:hypothetical protein